MAPPWNVDPRGPHRQGQFLHVLLDIRRTQRSPDRSSGDGRAGRATHDDKFPCIPSIAAVKHPPTMLKEIGDATFVRAGLRRWRLLADGRESEATWPTRRLRALQAAQAVAPVALLAHERGVTWAFEGRVYRTGHELTPADVLALVRERERRARRRLERAHAQLAQHSEP